MSNQLVPPSLLTESGCPAATADACEAPLCWAAEPLLDDGEGDDDPEAPADGEVLDCDPSESSIVPLTVLTDALSANVGAPEPAVPVVATCNFTASGDVTWLFSLLFLPRPTAM